jgi:hypothetical protein
MDMPLGGYCELCGRWVWVSRTGTCQFGHPAGSVRDVQPLRPRKGSRLPAQTAKAPPSRLPWGDWPWRHSLWVAWTLNPGLLNWIAFLYIGVRARYPLWVFWGFVYLVPLLLTIAAIGSVYLGPAVALQLFVAAVSVVHAFWVRPRYRALMLGAPPASEPLPPLLWTPGDRRALPADVDTDAVEAIREAELQVNAIARTGKNIGKPEVRDAVAGLCRTAEQILDELRREPRKVGIARGFLVYYLEAAYRIVNGYAELSVHGLESPDADRTLQQAEGALAEVQQAFERQLSDLLAQRLFELDTEIALLERTVQLEAPAALPPAGSNDQKAIEGAR